MGADSLQRLLSRASLDGLGIGIDPEERGPATGRARLVRVGRGGIIIRGWAVAVLLINLAAAHNGRNAKTHCHTYLGPILGAGDQRRRGKPAQNRSWGGTQGGGGRLSWHPFHRDRQTGTVLETIIVCRSSRGERGVLRSLGEDRRKSNC